MPTNAFQLPNPRALEPYSIESTLVGGLGDPTTRSMAMNLLNQYRGERGVAEGQYADEVAAQHQYMYDQLRSTMADNAAKNLQGFLKEPGGLELISDPNSPYRYLLGGQDSGVLSGVLGTRTRLANAGIAEKGGTAANQLIQAGFPPPANEVGALTGLSVTQGTPLRLQTAEIAASNKQGPHMMVPYKAGVDESGNAIYGTIPVPMNATPAQIAEIRRQAEQAYQGFYPPKGNVPGMNTGEGASAQPPVLTTPGTVGGNRGPDQKQYQGAPNPLLGGLPTPAEPGDGGAQAATPPKGRTNLPPAQRDTPAGGASAAPPPATSAPAQPTQQEAKPTSNQAIIDPQTQAKGKIALKLLPREAQADVLLNSPGGVLPILPGQSGVGFMGKSGRFYQIPGAK